MQDLIRLGGHIRLFEVLIFVFMQAERCAEFLFQPGQRCHVRLMGMGDVEIMVLLTAGHTKGSVCFWVKAAKALFSGSTLLKKSYGRIWGPSSMSLMHFSMKRLSSTIPAETTIYTGSGELTKMRNEGWIHCMRSA